MQRKDHIVDRRDVLLHMEDMNKAFPGVQALSNVDLEVRAGEIHGLIGENGAGKSTLMKILTGVYTKDSGQLRIEGERVEIIDPHHAQQLGISIIYQEFNLMPNLTVAENVFIGREPDRFQFIRWGDLRQQTQELLDLLGIHLSPRETVRDLSVAEQQMVEIAKALSIQSRIIIMDEPTSALTDTEVESLFHIMRSLKEQGLGVIFISHRLEEVFEICDRITVLRDGENVGTRNVEDVTPDEVIHMMVGRALGELFQKETSAKSGDVVLEVHDVMRTGTVLDPSAIALNNVNFQLHRGEILGLAGLIGSGRTALARVIFGADTMDRGEIYIDGERVDVHSPEHAIRHGMGFVPEDRQGQALILSMAVRKNVSLAKLGDLTNYGFVDGVEEKQIVEHYVDTLQIRTPSLDQKVMYLSGGNQQKVVIAKWLALEPKILIMDEPTRGIDVGAKAEVHALMNQLAQQGVGIIMISSELPEILGMSDRILCMREGQVVGELSRDEATPERVMRLLTTEEQVEVHNAQPKQERRNKHE
ncbi:MAG: Ribose import ATP-binding protein RbsA [Anaerolineales bacterium]|nr:Ribose import ATP-binding protein RbsA [Anaerolineales bacterium]